MAGGGSMSDGEPEFQVAPMIDVLLTLLVFFMMITSAQVLKVDKSIQLPVAKNALKKDTKRSEVVINCRWNAQRQLATFVVDDKLYTEADAMIPVLVSRRIANEKSTTKLDDLPFRAVIRGDRDCPAVNVSHAMNACATAGIADISFSAINKN